MTSALLLCLLPLAHSFSTSNVSHGKCKLANQVYNRPPSSLSAANKWDMLIDEDDDEDLQFNGLPVTRDMKYNMFNIKRQRENFENIKSVAGEDLTNDVYARDPETSVFWFAAKVARVSDISLEKAMARQWPMVEEHACRLRPAELYPQWGKLQLWVAPGDSELDVAYSKPELQFVQMFRDVDGASEVRNMEVGFAGELYEGEEEGFRTTRADDGKAVEPEILSNKDRRQPTEKELEEMMEVLNSQVEENSGDQ